MTIASIIMAGFGYLVLVALTLYVIKQTFAVIRMTMLFSGKLTGEAYFIAVVSLILMFLCYYLFPFQVIVNVVPISVK